MSKSYTEQQEKFLEVYFQEVYSGSDRKAAARIARDLAGYSENTAPYIVLNSVKEAVLERSLLELAAVLPKALANVESVMDDPTKPGATRILNAALALLDRAGVSKREQSEVTLKQPEGLIVIPAKKKEED